jgi:integrase
MASGIGEARVVSRTSRPLGVTPCISPPPGGRPGELSALQWRFIDFEAGTASLRHSVKVGPGGKLVLAKLKTKQSKRTLGMHPAVAAALR